MECDLQLHAVSAYSVSNKEKGKLTLKILARWMYKIED